MRGSRRGDVARARPWLVVLVSRQEHESRFVESTEHGQSLHYLYLPEAGFLGTSAWREFHAARIGASYGKCRIFFLAHKPELEAAGKEMVEKILVIAGKTTQIRLGVREVREEIFGDWLASQDRKDIVMSLRTLAVELAEERRVRMALFASPGTGDEANSGLLLGSLRRTLLGDEGCVATH